MHFFCRKKFVKVYKIRKISNFLCRLSKVMITWPLFIIELFLQPCFFTFFGLRHKNWPEIQRQGTRKILKQKVVILLYFFTWYREKWKIFNFQKILTVFGLFWIYYPELSRGDPTFLNHFVIRYFQVWVLYVPYHALKSWFYLLNLSDFSP